MPPLLSLRPIGLPKPYHDSVWLVIYPSPLRQLRIALGQTQDAVAERALGSGRVRPTFTRAIVAKAEAPKPEGLRSHEVRVAIATGLGLNTEDLDSYLSGGLGLAETITRSSIRPDPDVVAKLTDADARRGTKRMSERTSAGLSGALDPMPGLSAALEVARLSSVSERFLHVFERAARRSGVDRPGFEWVDDLRAQLGLWLRRHGVESTESMNTTASASPSGGCTNTGDPLISGFAPATSSAPTASPGLYPRRPTTRPKTRRS